MDKITKLSLDLETYSPADLQKCGVYRYSEHPEFEILLLCVSVNDMPPTVYDLACGENVPEEILAAISDENCIKWAFNANFERICLSNWLFKYHPEHFRSYSVPEDTVGRYLDPASWRCSMVLALYNGFPRSLEQVGAVLGLSEQKLKEGKELIRCFCVPCKATKSNGGRTRNLPEHSPERWELFKKYNKRDVEAEMQIQKRLQKYPVPAKVWEEYHLDQKINDRGILCDADLVRNAIKIDELSKSRITGLLKEKTHLENPNSVAQMKAFLEENNVKAPSLGKKEVAELMKSADKNIAEVLSLRQKLAKSSVRKYQAMDNAMCGDLRCRGMFLFYGANRSGRFSGRIVQLQNLPQNHMEDLSEARSLVKSGDYDTLDLLYDNVPLVLSNLIRTAFIPRAGYKYIVADFSAIEARVLSHLAGEKWRSEVFESGGDIYCASASKMFGVPVEKHGANSHLRQKGKIAELALGYGGGVGALKAMGAIEMGLCEEELQPLVNSWRQSNPHIVEYWHEIDDAVKQAVQMRLPAKVGCIEVYWRSGMLFITLPSGRRLSYVKPRITTNKFGGESVAYYGIDAKKKWALIESYGPKFVENIVQAISRDILCYAMRTLSHCFIVGHVHDELIIECSADTDLDAVCEQMGRTPEWIPGLALRADGFECEHYKKE